MNNSLTATMASKVTTRRPTRLDPNDTRIHIDQIESEPGPRPVTAGIPDSLSEALDDWISLQSTADDEIADFIGWSVDRVRDHR